MIGDLLTGGMRRVPSRTLPSIPPISDYPGPVGRPLPMPPINDFPTPRKLNSTQRIRMQQEKRRMQQDQPFQRLIQDAYYQP